jgi:GT2 family glycosyltransferase
MTVAVVVVTWNGREDTLACLRSVTANQSAGVNVVLVDNASTDGTVDAVRDLFPEVHVIASHHNRGFAGGNNLGIIFALKELDADFVMLLNNDTVIASNTITQLVADSTREASVGAVCPLIFFMDSPDLIWFGGASFDPKKGRSGRMTLYGHPGRVAPSQRVRIDRGVGAAMMVPRRVFEEVGLLDESLFFLYEDVELSLRMQSAGFSIWLAPEACVWHKVAGSQKGAAHTPTTAYYGTRNHLEICRRFAPLPMYRSLARTLVILTVHVAEVRFAEEKRQWLASVWDGFRDFRRANFGERSGSGTPKPALGS